MALMEMDSSPISAKTIYHHIRDELKKRYVATETNGEEVFVYSEDRYFQPELFPPPWNAIVIEYNGFDEGSLFYLEDYQNEADLLEDILKEIES